MQKQINLQKDDQNIKIYLNEDESRSKTLDYQVRIYGDGITNIDTQFKYKNFFSVNSSNNLKQATAYFDNLVSQYQKNGFVQKPFLTDFINPSQGLTDAYQKAAKAIKDTLGLNFIDKDETTENIKKLRNNILSDNKKKLD